MRRLSFTIAFALCLHASAAARAGMYVIENPASTISNPADKMYNPASRTDNPAANIYNPATRMDNPNPLSPPTKPASESRAAVSATPGTSTSGGARSGTAVSAGSTADRSAGEQNYRPAIPKKKYHFKTAGAYISAAKKAFGSDHYVEFLSITEDALRRIHAGTLKASAEAERKLSKYRSFGYGLLEK